MRLRRPSHHDDQFAAATDWITDCITYALENGKHVVKDTKEFEDNWVKRHDETAAATHVVKTDSW